MAQNDDGRTVYVLRMNIPGTGDTVEYGLRNNRIAVGYSDAPDLIEIAENANNHYPLREELKKRYSHTKWAPTTFGKKAMDLWRLLRGMQQDDFVLVPHGSKVYLAKVAAGPPGFDASYYRDVEWLNGKKPFARRDLRSDVFNATGRGTRGTSRHVHALLPMVLEMAEGSSADPFQKSLRKRLEQEAIAALRDLTETMNHIDFEYFVLDLFKRYLGARGAVRRGRADKGADVVLEMLGSHGLLVSTVAIQAKYHVKGQETGPDAVTAVVRGMGDDSDALGLVVTISTFSESAKQECDKANEDGHRVALIDGEDLARIIVECGITDTEQ